MDQYSPTCIFVIRKKNVSLRIRLLKKRAESGIVLFQTHWRARRVRKYSKLRMIADARFKCRRNISMHKYTFGPAVSM